MSGTQNCYSGELSSVPEKDTAGVLERNAKKEGTNRKIEKIT
jgi:hypothetical protein